MGRIGRSWELVKQSFAILQQDKELLLLPITSAIACGLVSGVIVGLLILWPTMDKRPAEWAALFLLYVANYLVIVFFNLALVGIASNRLSGGTWTLRDGLSLAWDRKGKVLQWALLAATVGIILRIAEDRLSWLGSLIARLVGVAWSLAAYFVVPVLAFEDMGPVDALKRSARLFSETWGTEVAGGFSFGIIFILLALPGVVLGFAAIAILGTEGMVVAGVLVVAYWLVLAAVSAAVQGIFMAALYRYATEHTVAPWFRQDNFAMAWQRK